MPDVELLLSQVGFEGRLQSTLTAIIFSLWFVTASHNSAPIILNTLPVFTCDTGEVNIEGKCVSSEGFQSLNHTYAGECVRFVGGKNESAIGVEKCNEEYIYLCDSKYDSVTIEFDLVCERKYLRAVTSMGYFFGLMVGSFFGGLLADRYGRKFALVVCTSGIFLSSLAVSLIPSFVSFALTRILVASFLQPCLTVGCVYLLEITHERKHIYLGLNMNTSYAAGVIGFAGIAFLIRHWRNMYLCFTATLIPFPILLFFMPESPRWLLVYNHIKRAKKSFRQIARVNGKKFSEELWRKFVISNKSEKSVTTKYSVFGLLKFAQLRIITCNMQFQWFTVSMVYFGLTLNVGDLAGNVYLNTVFLGVVNVLGCVLAQPLAHKLGCRRTLSLFLLIAGTSCGAANVDLLKQNAMNYVSIAFLMLGQMCVSGSFAILYLFVPQLYPTDVRNTAIGISSTTSMVGSFLSPLVLQLSDVQSYIPKVVFSVMTIMASFSTLFLPETKDEKLLNTVHEAEAVYIVRRKSSSLFRTESKKTFTSISSEHNGEVDQLVKA